MSLRGCGGSSSDEDSEKGILVEKTLYSADNILDEPMGYYQDIYGESTVTETEHVEHGTLLQI